jgi:hypothetical protein
VGTGVEESTYRRWKTWHERLLICFARSLDSLKKQLGLKAKDCPSVTPSSAHPENGQTPGKKGPPLAQIVRIIVNGNFWRSTHFACLSGISSAKLALNP